MCGCINLQVKFIIQISTVTPMKHNTIRMIVSIQGNIEVFSLIYLNNVYKDFHSCTQVIM